MGHGLSGLGLFGLLRSLFPVVNSNQRNWYTDHTEDTVQDVRRFVPFSFCRVVRVFRLQNSSANSLPSHCNKPG